MIPGPWRTRVHLPIVCLEPAHARCRARLRIDGPLSGQGVGTRRAVGSNVVARDDVPGRLSRSKARRPRTVAAKATCWLFENGGISLVLLVGLLFLGLVGEFCTGR